MKKEYLKKYAETIVHVGINLQEADNVVIFTDTHSVDLAREVVRECWRSGAHDVDCHISDDDFSLARFEEAQSDAVFDFVPDFKVDYMEELMKNHYHRIVITAPRLNLFENVDGKRLQRSSIASNKAMEPVFKYMDTGEIKWVVAASASEKWAKTLFSDLDTEDAMEKLWQQIFAACRIDDGDPIEAWRRHDAKLKAYENWLNQQNFSYLHYEGPGTDLKVGLVDKHKWVGGSSTTPDGVKYVANIPTEEIFTAPHALKVDGTVKATKPLSLSGKIIDDFSFTFEKGKVVDFHAGQNEDILKQQLEMDEGARHLGEVAIVPNSSPISQMDLVFQSTLFDENASCHFALGKAYAESIVNGEKMEQKERTDKGLNYSIIHCDFMVGGPELNITGYFADGSSLPILRQGEWAIELAD